MIASLPPTMLFINLNEICQYNSKELNVLLFLITVIAQFAVLLSYVDVLNI